MHDELSDDPNALAYKRLGKTFLEEHEGEYSAFSNGSLVGTSTDKAALLARMRKEHPAEPCLVVRIAKQERVVRFRRPRRMTKASHVRF